jgi:transcriptional regulator with XRE-family HTH domain
MEIVAQRIRALRESIRVPQQKIADMCGSNQSSINRYEHGQAKPPLELLAWYADYFDVSLDYIFGRTDNPAGKSYGFVPQYSEEDESFKEFIEMCFDPSSPLCGKLKQTLIDMVSRGGDKS